MTDIALEFDHVWKKFRKGEIHDSLRDLIPAVARSLVSGNHKKELQQHEFWALEDVSFQVKEGEVLGFVGPNGAGKSTILKLLSKILRPNRGDISVKGRISALIEIGAGFHPDLTGRENVYLNGAILGMTKDEISRKFDEIVDFSGIEDFIDTPVKRYSSGMYARLGFAVAAHVNTEILLVDEVLAVGDAAFQQKCLGKMSDVSSRGRTVLFVSHNMGALQNLCPRAILLRRGQIVCDGPSDQVVREYLSHLTASAESAFGVNPERTGNGWVRLTGAQILTDACQPSRMLIAGPPVTIEFTYENPAGLDRAHVSFTIFNSLGTAVSNFDMALTNSVAEGLGSTGKFTCALETLPFPIGQYRIAVAVTAKGERTDQLPNALVFDVVSSTFYETGRAPKAQYATCMLKHTWRHEADSPAAAKPQSTKREAN